MTDSKDIQKPTVSIAEITFSGGEVITLGSDDIVLIVGANNSGKSKTIAELVKTIGEHDHTLEQTLKENLVVKQVKLNKSANAESLQKFLDENAELAETNYVYQNVRLHTSFTKRFNQKMLAATAPLFQNLLNARSRLDIVNTQNGVGVKGHKTAPQHFLYEDEALMLRISNLFKDAFGSQLFFDHRGNPQIPIHVGEYPEVIAGEDRISDSYVAKVRNFPRIDDQGDGMKSYAGIVFQTIVFPRDITFIDEPEAFLHPPQMRRLGKTLATETKGQLIVATHSADILKGFLEANADRVRVIRLQREGNKNHATELPPNKVQELWSHPQIRYSTALEAIFHEQAIICEDDSDCRLYSAVANHLEQQEKDIRWKDTHYIPTGGKQAAPRVAEALKGLGVPIKMIFDFDLLSNEHELKKVTQSVGGDWASIQKDWMILNAEVRKGVKVKTVEEIAVEITKLLKDVSEGLPKSDILELMKQNKPWSIVKQVGYLAIPNGQASAAYEKLRDSLNSMGVYVVEKGQIEKFCITVGGHGPGFVSKLLETVDLGDAKLRDLREFIKSIIQSH